jgi:hypothetical protein
MKNLKFILSLLLLNSLNIHSAKADDLASSLYLRTQVESLTNLGDNGGSTVSIGGFSLIYFYPLTEKLFAGFGYHASFGSSGSAVAIHGMSVQGKYYFYGLGTIQKKSNQLGANEYRSTQSYYAMSSYTDQSYFLGKDTSAADENTYIQGKYANVNIGAGADWATSNRFGYNAELGMSLLSMSATSDKYRIRHMYVYGGISYFF